MIRNSIYIVLLLFVSCAVSAQSPKGDSLKMAGDMEGAILAYKAAYKAAPKDEKNTYALAAAMALTYYQPDLAFKYLNIALEESSSLWALVDNDLLSMTKDERWAGIVKQQLRKFQAENGAFKEPEYAEKLLHMIMTDQALDYQIHMARQSYMKNGHMPHWYFPLAQLKKDISKDNFTEMEALLQKYGWPKYSMVGELAADAVLLAINHHESEEVRIQYLERVKDACLTEEGSCMEYAKINDRILVNTDQLQDFGMQFRYDKNRVLEPFPIVDPEYVDQRRASIGLEPLKVYLKRKINYDWNVVQKKK
jgi:hypothetical protein